MSVSVSLMQTKSPTNKITKTTDNLTHDPISCILKENCSMMDPVLILDLSAITFETGYSIFSCNYLYIDSFNRYYHVKDITMLTDKLVQLTCHVDVLMSFAVGILASPCIVAKSESRFNLYLNDPQYKCKQNDLVLINTYSSGFPNSTDSRFILTIFGDKEPN